MMMLTRISRNPISQFMTFATTTNKLITASTIEAMKSNISQSPWKMNFLVKLIRGAWVPDAMAQLKFSPKHRAVDVARIVKRASIISAANFQTIPEELIVSEVMVLKGVARKRTRIMGRGRTGIGYKRSSHVTIKVSKIDFEAMIANAKTASQKSKWRKRELLVKKLKEKKVVEPLKAV